MEEKFWLSSAHPLTIEAIQNILQQQATLNYLPDNEVNIIPSTENFKPSDLTALAIGLGEEVPAEITKLMLVLLGDFITKNSFAASPSVISRLVEFYRFEIFPQVFTQGLYGSPTAHLILPVFGRGQVYYQGYLLKAVDVHDIFSWQPIILPATFPVALLDASFLGLGSLVYSFLQFKKIYRYSQLLLPESSVINKFKGIFPAQAEQLEKQLNEALAFPSDQHKHVGGLSIQIKKLLATFSEHIAEQFSVLTIDPDSSELSNENLTVKPKHLQRLLKNLTQENVVLYEAGSQFAPGLSVDNSHYLVLQPYHLLKNLEQIMALATILHLNSIDKNPENNVNSSVSLVAQYRNQVINVLKEIVFVEQIRKTVSFMYATVSSD